MCSSDLNKWNYFLSNLHERLLTSRSIENRDKLHELSVEEQVNLFFRAVYKDELQQFTEEEQKEKIQSISIEYKYPIIAYYMGGSKFYAMFCKCIPTTNIHEFTCTQRKRWGMLPRDFVTEENCMTLSPEIIKKAISHLFCRSYQQFNEYKEEEYRPFLIRFISLFDYGQYLVCDEKETLPISIFDENDVYQYLQYSKSTTMGTIRDTFIAFLRFFYLIVHYGKKDFQERKESFYPPDKSYHYISEDLHRAQNVREYFGRMFSAHEFILGRLVNTPNVFSDCMEFFLHFYNIPIRSSSRSVQQFCNLYDQLNISRQHLIQFVLLYFEYHRFWRTMSSGYGTGNKIQFSNFIENRKFIIGIHIFMWYDISHEMIQLCFFLETCLQMFSGGARVSLETNKRIHTMNHLHPSLKERCQSEFIGPIAEQSTDLSEQMKHRMLCPLQYNSNHDDFDVFVSKMKMNQMCMNLT